MRVAIAGYGDLTRYICQEFSPVGHDVIILTRSYKPELDKQKIPQAVTDYTASSLRSRLADCDVLISTISDCSPAYTDIHRALLLACQESPRCKRFIPAEFAADIETYPDQPGFYFDSHEPIRELLRGQTNIEWTLVCIGWLADYFVPARNRYIRDIEGLHPVHWGEKRVEIPGTGTEPVDFTWARDVVRGLAALVNAPPGSWEPYTFMAGERGCWNSAIKLFQPKFYRDFPVEHISLYAAAEMIKAAKSEEQLMLADYYLLSISQACGNPPEKVGAHRKKYFQDVHYRTLQEGLAELDRDLEMTL